MPAIYTHYCFGEEMKKVYSPHLQKIIQDNIELYEIGLHGPDIFFYYQIYHHNDLNRWGSAMHKQKAYDLFENSRHVILEKSHKEAKIAYMLGFIAHFALDYECHSYIEKKMQVSHVSHSLIECEMDKYLLIKNHQKPLYTDLTQHLHPTMENAKVIQTFFNQFSVQQILSTLKSVSLFTFSSSLSLFSISAFAASCPSAAAFTSGWVPALISEISLLHSSILASSSSFVCSGVFVCSV